VILRRVALVPAFAVMVLLAVPTAGGARAADPTVAVTPPDAAPGARATVSLEHWPAGAVTVAVCGNAGRRGSQDCDMIGAQGAGIAKKGLTVVDLTLTAPPVSCTCVIRVSTQDSSIVRTVPINLLGVPNGPDIPGNPPSTPASLGVEAKVEGGSSSWASVFAGPTHRRLVLTLRNRSDQPLSGLRVGGMVGRDAGGGTPLDSRAIAPIAPGSLRKVTIPIDLDAPVWGDYVVSGRVYRYDAAVPFESTTSNDPWGLELLLPLALIVVARWLRRRDRAREADAVLPPAVGLTSSELLQDCSPEVGVDDGMRSRGPAYDPDDAVWVGPAQGSGPPEALVTGASTASS
jgi:hypothetical protein